MFLHPILSALIEQMLRLALALSVSHFCPLLGERTLPADTESGLPLCLQVHHINANYFLDITSVKPEEVESSIFSFSASFEDPSTATYLQFLKEGLQRAKPFLQP